MKALRHVGVVVSDMEKSLAFYRDLLKLKVVKDFSDEGGYIDSILGLKGVKLRMVKLITEDGSMVELLHYISHPRTPLPERQICEIGCSHIAFTVSDIDSEYERLSSVGVEFTSPPFVSPDGHAKVAFCREPNGVFIELVEVL